MVERFGYFNRVLHVDLTDERTWVEEPGDEWFRKFGGGRALIVDSLLKHVPPGADPLGPENILVFAPGVITGTPVPGSGRHSVGGKSPLTGGYGEAEAGGYWGAELKRAGWDGIVVHGRASAPRYIWINDDVVEIRDAAHLWGYPGLEVEDMVRAELDQPLARVAQCGPAGENLVRFATVGNDLNEYAARTGMGAVMGSKRLKAVAVRGTKQVPVADKKGLIGMAKWVSSTLDTAHQVFHDYGTGANMQGKDLEGGMPTHNYRLGTFPETAKVDAIAVAELTRIEMGACFACSVRCKKVVQVEQFQENAGVTKRGKPIYVDPDGRWSVNPRYGGPEYESLAALGPSVGVGDLVAVLKSNELCNALGLDTISAGSTIAWAMEAWEKGLLSGVDTDGLELSWGNGALVVQLLEMIARREGLGDLLAEGSQHAAAKLGKGSEAFLTTVKGLELAMHDPRHMDRMRTTYMTAPTGGDHMQQHDFKNGGRNQVGMCHFLQYSDEQSVQILNAVTGWDIGQSDWDAIARRGLTLTRLFNLREGFGRKDDRLPARFSEPLPRHEGFGLEKQAPLLDEYYDRQGWDRANGVPTDDTLAELGLEAYSEVRSLIA